MLKLLIKLFLDRKAKKASALEHTKETDCVSTLDNPDYLLIFNTQLMNRSQKDMSLFIITMTVRK